MPPKGIKIIVLTILRPAGWCHGPDAVKGASLAFLAREKRNLVARQELSASKKSPCLPDHGLFNNAALRGRDACCMVQVARFAMVTGH